MPTSMPTIRETTSSALVTPCTLSAVLASRAALTGASASPKPSPVGGEDGRGRQVRRSDSGPQPAISRKPMAASSIPQRRRGPGGHPPDERTADQGAHRQGDQELEQHERGLDLGPLGDGDPREDRDVDECGDQGRADEEADQQRTPGRPPRERAVRHQRCLRAPVVQREQHGGDRGDAEVAGPGRGEHLHLRVGRGEGQDHSAEGDGEEPAPSEVGRTRRAPPVAQVDQRPRGVQQPGEEAPRRAARVTSPSGENQIGAAGPERHERSTEVDRAAPGSRGWRITSSIEVSVSARRRRPIQSRWRQTGWSRDVRFARSSAAG